MASVQAAQHPVDILQVLDLPQIMQRVTYILSGPMRHFQHHVLRIVNGRSLEFRNGKYESVTLNPLQVVAAPMEPPQALNRIQFEQDGSVRMGQSGRPLEFSFAYLGLRFGASTRQVDSGTILQVAADVAPDPYSVEGASLRRAVHAVIDASHDLSNCRLVVTKQKRIYCIGKATVPQSATPAEVISGAVEIVLEIKPYLDMLAEILPNWPRHAGRSGDTPSTEAPEF
jgi:hypothetical protein